MSHKTAAAFLVLLSTLLLPSLSPAQNSGIQPFATLGGGPLDAIDLASSNIMITIPVRVKTSKIPFSYRLILNSHLSKNGTAWSVKWGPLFVLGNNNLVVRFSCKAAARW